MRGVACLRYLYVRSLLLNYLTSDLTFDIYRGGLHLVFDVNGIVIGNGCGSFFAPSACWEKVVGWSQRVVDWRRGKESFQEPRREKPK